MVWLRQHIASWHQFATRGLWLVVVSLLLLYAALRWGHYPRVGDGLSPGSD